MDKVVLVDLLENPGNISENDLERLEDIVANYPYCQIAHQLIAKYTKDKESMLAPQKIRRAASYAYNRVLFRKLIERQYQEIDEKETGQEFITEDKLLKEQSTLSEKNLQEIDLESPLEESPHIASFFDSIENLAEKPAAMESPQEMIPEKKTEPPVQQSLTSNEEITEENAMALFNKGKEAEAILIYKKLIELNPEKRGYYRSQLSILTGDDSYLFYDEEEHSLHIPPHHNPFDEKEDSTLVQLSTKDKVDESSVQNQEPESFQEINTDKQEVSQDDLTNAYFENIQEEKIITTDIQTPTPTEALTAEILEEPSTTSLQDFVNLKEEEPTIEPVEEAFIQEKTEEATPIVQPFDVADKEVTEEEALKFFREGNEEKAVEIYKKLIRIFPEKKGYYLNQLSILVDDEALLRSLDHPEESESTTQLSEKEDALSGDAETPSGQSFFDTLSLDLTSEKKESHQNEEPDFLNKEEIPKTEEQPFTDEASESQAILYFNQGKIQEAISVYETLIEKNPYKSSYYRSQIAVLQKDLMAQSESLVKKEDKTVLPEENAEEVSERMAILLFNQGRTDEAIKVYEQLMLLNPEKKAYFASQIEILKS